MNSHHHWQLLQPLRPRKKKSLEPALKDQVRKAMKH